MSSNANTNQVSFKIKFTKKNEFRRVTFENPTWEEFLSYVTESGRLQTTKDEDGSRIVQPNISYQDEDGDIIKISTQIEFEEALQVLANKSVKTFFVSSQEEVSHDREANKEAPKSSSSSSSSSSPKKENVPKCEIDIDLDSILSLADEFFKSFPQRKETKEEPQQQSQQKSEEQQQQQRKNPQFKFPVDEILKEFKGAENVLGDLFTSFAQNLPKGSKPQEQNNNNNNNNSRNQQPSFENIIGPIGGFFQDILKQTQRSSSASPSSCSQQEIDSKDKQLYSEQLKTLKDLGFTNEELNLAYLRSANGNVERVAASLYEQAAC